MKARSLLEHATFEPETLTAIFAAFDKAWLEIADRFPENADEMRTRLAHAMLVVAREDSRDVERLKNEALQVVALAFRDHRRVPQAPA